MSKVKKNIKKSIVITCIIIIIVIIFSVAFLFFRPHHKCYVCQKEIRPRPVNFSPNGINFSNKYFIAWTTGDYELTPELKNYTFHTRAIAIREYDGENWSKPVIISHIKNGTVYDCPMLVVYNNKLYVFWVETHYYISEYSEFGEFKGCIYYRYYDGQEWSSIFNTTITSNFSQPKCLMYNNMVYIFMDRNSYLIFNENNLSSLRNISNVDPTSYNVRFELITYNNSIFIIWGNRTSLNFERYNGDAWESGSISTSYEIKSLPTYELNPYNKHQDVLFAEPHALIYEDDLYVTWKVHNPISKIFLKLYRGDTWGGNNKGNINELFRSMSKSYSIRG